MVFCAAELVPNMNLDGSGSLTMCAYSTKAARLISTQTLGSMAPSMICCGDYLSSVMFFDHLILRQRAKGKEGLLVTLSNDK